MQVIRAIGFSITVIVQTADSQSRSINQVRPARVGSAIYGFSVMFPPGWFVFKLIDPPMLFSYAPSEALPQDLLPVNGARITFHVSNVRSERLTDLESLTSRAEKLVRSYKGLNVSRRLLDDGERPPGIALALHLSFDEGTEDSIHIEEDLLPFQKKVVGISFECTNGDSSCNYHERTFRRVIKSFRPEHSWR